MGVEPRPPRSGHGRIAGNGPLAHGCLALPVSDEHGRAPTCSTTMSAVTFVPPEMSPPARAEADVGVELTRYGAARPPRSNGGTEQRSSRDEIGRCRHFGSAMGRALQKLIPPIIRDTLVAASLIVGAIDELAR